MTLCRICSERTTIPFLSLGRQPHCNRFLRAEQLDRPEPTYPLDLVFCPRCTLVQLGTAVDREVLFRDHPYVSGTTRTLREHFRRLAKEITSRYALRSDSLVVDVGSNDGTWLEGYSGVRTLGVEPAPRIAALSRAKGIDTVEEFFGLDCGGRIAKAKGRASVITAAGVFFHIDHLHDFMGGVDALLAGDGVFVVQAMYLLDIIDRTAFDAVYHEHVEYYSIRALTALFDRFAFEITDVIRDPIHGGSFIVHVQRKGRGTARPSVGQALEGERKLHELQTYRAFAHRVDRIRVELPARLREWKSQGKRLAAYGAPARGNTLLNACSIGPDLLEFAAEKNPLKFDLYTPGMRIPVRDESKVLPPDLYLVLAWNFFEEFLEKETEFVRRGGKFVLPLPEPRVVP